MPASTEPPGELMAIRWFFQMDAFARNLSKAAGVSAVISPSAEIHALFPSTRIAPLKCSANSIGPAATGVPKLNDSMTMAYLSFIASIPDDGSIMAPINDVAPANRYVLIAP